MRRILFWATVVSAATAVYLLRKRGVPYSEIAREVSAHPIRSMVNELHIPAPQPRGA